MQEMNTCIFNIWMNCDMFGIVDVYRQRFFNQINTPCTFIHLIRIVIFYHSRKEIWVLLLVFVLFFSNCIYITLQKKINEHIQLSFSSHKKRYHMTKKEAIVFRTSHGPKCEVMLVTSLELCKNFVKGRTQTAATTRDVLLPSWIETLWHPIGKR